MGRIAQISPEQMSVSPFLFALYIIQQVVSGRVTGNIRIDIMPFYNEIYLPLKLILSCPKTYIIYA